MKKIAVIILSTLMLCGCGKDNYYDIYGDLLKVNDITYMCCNITIPDKSIIGRAVARVKSKVEDSLAVSGRTLENGDSFSLKEGTTIYELTGIDLKDMIAVKWKNDRYLVYVNCEKTDDVGNKLRSEIEHAAVVRIKEFEDGRVKRNREIYDIKTVNNIKEAFYNTREYEDELESFSRFYEMEFLVPDINGVYKPCLSISCRVSESKQYGVIYDKGIKKINLDIRNIMQ